VILLALRLARRELRAGLRGLRVVLACLALGVAAIAAVGTLRAGVEHGLAAEGRRILGGDLEIEGGAQRLPDTLRAWLRARGAAVSDVVTMRSMLVAPGGQRLLVELKAVDGAWPLVGQARTDPPMPLSEALAPQGEAADALAEPLVFERLGVAPGAELRLGRATVVLRGRLTDEPDRVASALSLGPRVLIGTAALAGTGLLQPGAIVEYRLRAVLASGDTPAAATAALRTAFPDTGWRIRDAHEAAPGIARFVDQVSLFLTLVGLTALLVGGIGVANGVQAWLTAKARGIATLRCLGAAPRLVFLVCLIQVLALAALGVVAGVAAGGALPVLAAPVLVALLPLPLRLGLYPAPLLLAGGYGLLTAATFALWPLGRALRIGGAALFRDTTLPQPGRPPVWLIAANAALAATLVAVVVAGAAAPWFALGFCAVSAAALALFRLGAAGLTALLARVPPPRHAWARLGLANLWRPGAPTGLMLVSVGLGLATLATVALVEGNVRAEVAEQIPEKAPSFFFVDIQNDQVPAFRTLVAATPGASDFAEVPSLRARIVAVDGVPADRVNATRDTQWALRGDRGLTYAAAMPEGTRLTEGAWWPAEYRGSPLVSFDANLARGWGVRVGSTIRVNVLGRDIDLRVASLRDIAWRTMGINFTLVASPGLLEGAPHTHIATVRATAQAEAGLLRAATDAFPNVSAIRVADVLQAVTDLLDKLGATLRASGGVTLAAGALVLSGAVAAGQRRRVREAVVLRTLGATRAQIRAAWMVEFGVLGLAAGSIAATVGTAASWAVMHFVMGAAWHFLPLTLAATLVGSLALMLALGYAGTAAALRAKPAALLRNE
jgi:putative ABC transport system permease protein